MALLLQVIEEGQDQIGIDVGKLHGMGRFTEVSRGEAEEEHQPVTVAGNGAWTQSALRYQVLSKERLHE
jgi:hypothetical protein